MAIDLERLMLEVAGRLGKPGNPAVREGYVTSVVSSDIQFRDANRLTERDNHWTHGWVIWTNPANALNQWAGVRTNENIEPVVGAHTRSAGITFWAPLPAAITSGDRYQAHLYEPTRIFEALNHAITSAYPAVRRDDVSETLLVESNVYSYAVPSLLTTISRVELQIDQGTETYPYLMPKGSEWWTRIDRSSGTPVRTIQFRQHPGVVGNIIRVIGDGPLEPLTLLGDTLAYDNESSAMDIITNDAIRRLLDEVVRGSGYLQQAEIDRLAKTAEKNYEDSRKRHGLPPKPVTATRPLMRPRSRMSG